MTVVVITCITAALGAGCPPAEYEWAYTDDDMNSAPPYLDWIPLCEECCAYWRRNALGKRYRVRSIRPTS